MRRQARQWALMILYAMDVAGARAERAASSFFLAFGDGEPIDPPPDWDTSPPYRIDAGSPRAEEARAFALDRVEGVERHREALDAAIRQVSTNWRMERMAVLDRNVLRLGAFEILYRADDVPRKVAINEAVELAKMFGARESGAFVNGILDRLGP